MINLNEIERYRENNRIEAKKALGGLPESIWETYSAFANTLGGIILLGVEEYRDHSLHTVDLPHPEEMVELFFDKVNDRHKASANILSRNDVFIAESGGNHIIVINVPRASRSERPVYINGHIEETYRRSGEGDYRCTKYEIESMLRDAEKVTRDMHCLSQLTMDDLDMNSWHAYRSALSYAKSEAGYDLVSDEELLCEIHAAKKNGSSITLTRAGVLLSGREEVIHAIYPAYALVCDGEVVHGNLYTFYEGMKEKVLHLSLESDVRHAVLEAILNSIVNADYDAGGPLSITFSEQEIRMENPGAFRIAFEQAVDGGNADPRNSAIAHMFNLIGEGNHNGSGIPGIWNTWRKHGFALPVLQQLFGKDRTVLVLPLYKKTEAVKETRMIMRAQAAFIIQYLTDNISATADELCEVMHVEETVMTKLLTYLLGKDIIIHDDSLNPIYRLKA